MTHVTEIYKPAELPNLTIWHLSLVYSAEDNKRLPCWSNKLTLGLRPGVKSSAEIIQMDMK